MDLIILNTTPPMLKHQIIKYGRIIYSRRELERGFQNENYEIETMKLLIKSILANKIVYHRNSTKYSLKDYIQEIKRCPIEELLQNL